MFLKLDPLVRVYFEIYHKSSLLEYLSDRTRCLALVLISLSFREAQLRAFFDNNNLGLCRIEDNGTPDWLTLIQLVDDQLWVYFQ